MTPMPTPEYECAPCPKCGAATALDAVDLCQQTRGIDDEFHCPGEFSDNGDAIRPTAAYLAALDAWCSEQVGEQA